MRIFPISNVTQKNMPHFSQKSTLDELAQLGRGRRADADLPAALHIGEAQVQLLGIGLDVGYLGKDAQQFGHVVETRKARVFAVALARGLHLHCSHGVAKLRRPGVEMVQAQLTQPLGLQVTHHGVHLDNRVADGRARGKGHVAPGDGGLAQALAAHAALGHKAPAGPTAALQELGYSYTSSD